MTIKCLSFLPLLLLGACQSSNPAPSGPPQPPTAGGGIPIQSRSPDGKFMRLADGSNWQVQPAGQGASLAWQPGDPIQVITRPHPSYPFVLANSRTGKGTRAKFLNRSGGAQNPQPAGPPAQQPGFNPPPGSYYIRPL